MKRKEFMSRFVTNILYADLSNGDNGFLKRAYDVLKLYGNKRIMAMRTKYNKILYDSLRAVCEDIIGIIVEELCQKGNDRLYEEFMNYYFRKCPWVKEEFDRCNNDALEWLKFSCRRFEIDNRDEYMNLMQKYTYIMQYSYFCLYCITYGKNEAVEEFLKEWREYNTDGDGSFECDFYDLQNVEDGLRWLENVYGIRKTNFFEKCEKFSEKQRRLVSEYLHVEQDKLEEELLNRALEVCLSVYPDDDHLYMMGYKTPVMVLNDICKKYHISSLQLDPHYEKLYLYMMKDVFERWCLTEVYNRTIKWLYVDKELGKKDINFTSAGEDRCISEVLLMFSFECYIIKQQGMWDDYYEKFSFDGLGNDNKKLLTENNALQEEIDKCRKKIQQYEIADSERKRQHNKDVRMDEKKKAAETFKLQKQIEKQEKEIQKQCDMLADRDKYIDFLERIDDRSPDEKELDYSKLYNNRIVFVGGMVETVVKLKAMFSNATFIDNENMAIPQKIDLIVLLPNFINHPLYFKYIGLSREKGINAIYCNETNVEAIARKVSASL